MVYMYNIVRLCAHGVCMCVYVIFVCMCKGHFAHTLTCHVQKYAAYV